MYLGVAVDDYVFLLYDDLERKCLFICMDTIHLRIHHTILNDVKEGKMSIIQVDFYVPPEIEIGLKTGVYELFGGVVRYATGTNKGRIVKHLKTVKRIKTDDATGVIRKASQFAKAHKTELIITGAIVSGGAAVGGFIYAKKRYESKLVSNFREALKDYVDAINNGELDLDVINALSNALNELKQYKKFDKLSAKYSLNEIETLYTSYLTDYTIKLAEANEYNLTDEFDENEQVNILNLEKYLIAQKNIIVMEEAS